MKPPPFAYARAASAEEAVALLATHGEDARVLAGGQSLLAMLNMRLLSPGLLLDVGRAPDLAGIAVTGGALEVGAAVTQAALLRRPTLAAEVPLLAAALPWVGHAQTRSRGTVCGSVAHADPSAEIPLVLLALGGQVLLRRARGRRTLPAEDFLRGMLTTARRPDELVVAVRFPLRARGEGHAFREVGRRLGDYALCAVAVAARADGLRIAVAGLSDRPVTRDWPALSGTALDDALNALAWELRGADDGQATARHRRHLLRSVGREAVEEATACRS